MGRIKFSPEGKNIIEGIKKRNEPLSLSPEKKLTKKEQEDAAAEAWVKGDPRYDDESDHGY